MAQPDWRTPCCKRQTSMHKHILPEWSNACQAPLVRDRMLWRHSRVQHAATASEPAMSTSARAVSRAITHSDQTYRKMLHSDGAVPCSSTTSQRLGVQACIRSHLDKLGKQKAALSPAAVLLMALMSACPVACGVHAAAARLSPARAMPASKLYRGISRLLRARAGVYHYAIM